MFATVSAQIADRRLSSQRTVGLVRSLEEATETAAAATFKGLAFVQMYATYEYAVRSGVQATLAALRATAVELRTLRRDLLALVLDSHWDSASASGRSRVWDSRMALIAHVDSRESTASVRDDLFPTDGSHYRVSQIRTIWKIFCVGVPVVPDPRLIAWIDELIENRNAISHGRRTPEDVGARYSWQEIGKRVDDTDAICRHVIGSLESHVLTGGLVRDPGGA
jgi:hypothetical protein